MKKILILGRGYVGNNIIKNCKLSADTIYILKSREDLDYGNISTLNKFILNNDITHVVNCFGFTGRPNVDEGEHRKKECWELNVNLPLKISNLCRSLGIHYIHISSGCVYTGYEKEFTEEDEPNFGLFDESSFYSKSKHAFEISCDYGCIIRVRMPFCNELNERSYITKILKYNNLINYTNSKTYIPELCEFVYHLIDNDINCNDIGKINFVNPNAGSTLDIVDSLTSHDLVNPNWKFVDIEDLDLAAPRSNCVLSINKLRLLFPDFIISTENEAVEKALKYSKIEK